MTVAMASVAHGVASELAAGWLLWAGAAADDTDEKNGAMLRILGNVTLRR